MFTESHVLSVIKTSEHGRRFTETVEKVLETVAERILLEDVSGFRMLEKVGVVLYHYIEFNLREAIASFGRIRDELFNFTSLLRRDNSVSNASVRTWNAIERILVYLVRDGDKFLEIAASETLRLNAELEAEKLEKTPQNFKNPLISSHEI